MAFTVSAKDDKPRFLIPVGQYKAVCYAIYDLGTQHNIVYGSWKPKMAICWELPELQIDFTDDNNQPIKRPATMIQRYTRSLHEKANLRADLESWRCKAFSVDELKEFDISRLLGQPCMMQITHNENGGKIYANISALMKMPQGSTVSGSLEKRIYNIGEDGLEALPEWLPNWVKDLVRASKEHQDYLSEMATNFAPQDNAADAPVESVGAAEDDLPF